MPGPVSDSQGWLKEFDRLKGFEAENAKLREEVERLKHFERGEMIAVAQRDSLQSQLTQAREEYERAVEVLKEYKHLHETPMAEQVYRMRSLRINSEIVGVITNATQLLKGGQ